MGNLEMLNPEPLTDIEARVLGCLVEKEISSAKANPLTLNALTAACNQKSSRVPVVDYDDATVVRGLNGLREKKLAVMVHKAGSRVAKYEHLMRENLDLTHKELALLCVLILRGPQTQGEMRGRTERMHSFQTIAEVEEVIADLEGGERRYVMLLPRRAGQKERRYAHLLAGEPDVTDGDETLPPEAAVIRVREADERVEALEDEVKALREEMADLRKVLEIFKSQFE